MGFLLALGAALAWGSYFVPFKKSKSEKLILFQLLMSFGIVVSGFVISLLMGYSLNINLAGLLSGILWGSANILSLSAVLYLGLSKAIPLMSSLVIVTSFLWGTLFLKEQFDSLISGIVGIALIIFGVIVVSTTGNTKGRDLKLGLITAILAGLIFGSQFTPIKIASLDPNNYFFSMCLGIFLTAAVIGIFKRVKIENIAVKESIFSGIIWNIGNLFGVIAISLIGLSKGLPLTQSSVLVGIIWGILYFKEIAQIKQKIQILIGAGILLIGVVVLSSA